METRKLQQVGGGTFTVSIPKDWATEHALEAGARVHLYTHSDGSVVVRSAERDGGHLDAVTLDVGEALDSAGPDDPDPVTRLLRAAQTVGFESVTLTHPTGFTDDQRRAVRSAVGALVGTELVVERETELTVRNLLDAADVSARQSVVQLQFVALSVHRAATAAFVESEDCAADRLADRRDEADRLCGMVARHCRRSLTSLAALESLGVTRPELFEYYETARHLRAVTDAGVRVARVADRLSDPPDEAVASAVDSLGAAAREVVEDAAGAVLGSGDVAAAHGALDDCERVRADVAAVDDALFGGDDDIDEPAAVDGRPGTESPTEGVLVRDADALAEATGRVALARALDPLARTADRGGRIARVALRRAVRPEESGSGTGSDEPTASAAGR